MKAFDPALEPMLARLSRELPIGDYIYEPKWDGFRCLAFASKGAPDLRSRNHKPLARYFPELVEAFSGVRCDRTRSLRSSGESCACRASIACCGLWRTSPSATCSTTSRR
jgi:ATP-dependent DNA ligase